MMSLPSLAAIRPRVTLVTMLAGVTACASGSSRAPDTAGLTSAIPAGVPPAASAPVLLSCPAGQQALMRQVVVAGAVVPQVECVSAAPMATAARTPAVAATTMVAATAASPTYASAPLGAYQPVAPAPVRRRPSSPEARRVAHDDDIVEYRRPSRRSWQKSALIIGSAAGAGAGVGAATGGKKGAVIGAAIGGGAATVWDQVTRRQPR